MRNVLAASALAVCSVVATPAMATNLEISLSNETAEFSFINPVKQGLQTEGGIFYHEDDGYMLTAALVSKGQRGDISGGVGARFAFIDVDNEDADESGFGIGVGGDVVWQPNGGPFSVKGYLWHAPSVLSFSDLDGYTFFGAQLQYEIFSGSTVYLGYRDYTAEFEDYRDDAEIDAGGYFGIAMRF